MPPTNVAQEYHMTSRFPDSAAHILIIGYGNPLCGDDGVGWAVIDALQEVVPDGSAVAVHQLTPELAEPVSQARVVIFVDAAVEGEPGELACFALEGDAGWQPALHGSHLTTPDALLAMALDLFGRRPPAYMVTIAGESFELSESLTPTVEAAATKAIDRVLELVTSDDPL
jgi:hydrogenase maturation protease